MEDFLHQIEKALEFNLYYLALQSTLTLPDICGALESQDGQATKNKYIDWYNNYFNEPGFLSAEDCYYFRCANVHQARTTHENLEYSRILFLEPQTTSVTMHNCVLNKGLCIDINIFCNNMIASVRNWLTLVQNNTNFQNNYPNIIKRYPDGLSPYIKGAPVIS